MIVDARLLEKEKIIDTDVCIIGAGLAGITIAREFINDRNHVSLVESGGLKPDKQTQMLQWGENIGHPYYSLDTARPRFLGGSLNRWHLAVGEDCSYARMRPLDQIDFEKRDWIPHSGWPVEKLQLDPFYDRAQSVCKINPPTFEVIDWENVHKRPKLKFSGDRLKTVIFKFGSKQAFLEEQFRQIDQAKNITTYTYANAVEIETDTVNNSVSRLRVVTPDGNSLWIKAKFYALAAGAIEIARLMLASNQVRTAGVGNEFDLVGRYFMEHPHFTAGILVPASQGIFRNAALYTARHDVNHTPIIGKIALSSQVLKKEKVLSHVLELIPKTIPRATLHKFPIVDREGVYALKALRRDGISKAKIVENVKNILANLDDVGLAVYRQAKSGFFKVIDRSTVNVFSIQSMSEQAPNPESRVLLCPERDALGMNRVKLNWKITSQDMDSIVKTLKIFDREFQHAGIGKIYRQLYNEIPNENIYGGWHHMGTTRMSADPKHGVVEENCRVHSVKNLYIAGPSVFPTGGYANPALTVVALCIRLADHLKNKLG